MKELVKLLAIFLISVASSSSRIVHISDSTSDDVDVGLDDAVGDMTKMVDGEDLCYYAESELIELSSNPTTSENNNRQKRRNRRPRMSSKVQGSR
jgi:hypothetical protein